MSYEYTLVMDVGSSSGPTIPTILQAVAVLMDCQPKTVNGPYAITGVGELWKHERYFVAGSRIEARTVPEVVRMSYERHGLINASVQVFIPMDGTLPMAEELDLLIPCYAWFVIEYNFDITFSQYDRLLSFRKSGELFLRAEKPYDRALRKHLPEPYINFHEAASGIVLDE